MSTLRKVAAPLILAGIIMVPIVPVLVDQQSASVASQAAGTDDAFAAYGLDLRENQVGGASLRWTKRKSAFQFDGLGPGLVDIDLVARDHRTDVTLVANGAIVGLLKVGQSHFSQRVSLTGKSLLLEMITDGFLDHSRTLGTQLISLNARPVTEGAVSPRDVPLRLWLALFVVLLLSVSGAAGAGLSPWSGLFAPAMFLSLVLPAGLWRSGWLLECTVLLGAAIVVSALAAGRARGSALARSSMQIALLLGLTVHGVLPPSPLVAQADVQLHGHKLGQTRQGNLFPTSRTDHKPPFEIPYGFSFYGVMAPWASSDVANVAVVRDGAAFFSALSALALATMLGRTSAALSAASMLLWTFAPVNLRTMGYGNLSNLFAQAMFVLFLVAAGSMRNGVARRVTLTLLVAISGTAHLSSFIVLMTLTAVALVLPRERSDSAVRPLVAGTVAAGAYYATFLPMILTQVPRLLTERGGSAGVFDPWRVPGQIVSGAGWPLVALVALTLLVRSVPPIVPLKGSLAVAGVLLALAALVSPIEVRYLLALMPLLATAGAATFEEEGGTFPRQNLSAVVDLPWLRTLGRVSVPIAVGLVAAAIVQGVRVLQEFMPLMGG